jgi:flagella basal body P-ring formation protein FlgA
MTKCLLLFWVSSGLVLAGCVPVTGNRILGRDLALADVRFASLPTTLTIGFAPAPGAQRIYSARELQRLARASGIPIANYDDICFELPMRRITEEEVIPAMRASLPDEAILKIVELANFDVPAGPVAFPIEGLEPAAPGGRGVQLWRGHAKYAETRQMPVWARVEVAVPFTAVVAARDLPQDVAIAAASLRIENRIGPLERAAPATRIEDVQGRIPRRPLKAGSVIPLGVLSDAPAVRRGDPVTVVVQSGLARVRFEAIAEKAARDGDIVELRNPANGKTFKARLDPGPKVLVIIAAGQGL